MQERVCAGKRLQIGIRASSTLAWYKNRGRINDEVVYNFDLDGVLYAEAGWPAYLLKIQTCYSENRCQSVLWQRIIPITGESFPPGGSHFRLRRQ